MSGDQHLLIDWDEQKGPTFCGAFSIVRSIGVTSNIFVEFDPGAEFLAYTNMSLGSFERGMEGSAER